MQCTPDMLDIKFSVIGVTETWLRESDPLYNIHNYKFVANGRQTKRGGGVGLYIRNDLQYTSRTDLDINEPYIEYLFVELQNFSRNIIIGVLYRPPNQPVQPFIESMDNLLRTINTENKSVFLLGDFNLNLLEITSCNNCLYPLIHNPTGVTSHSANIRC